MVSHDHHHALLVALAGGGVGRQAVLAARRHVLSWSFSNVDEPHTIREECYAQSSLSHDAKRWGAVGAETEVELPASPPAHAP